MRLPKRPSEITFKVLERRLKKFIASLEKPAYRGLASHKDIQDRLTDCLMLLDADREALIESQNDEE